MVYDMWCLQGCVVQIHASMEANVQRLLTSYVIVHQDSKGCNASMVSVLPHMINRFINLHSPPPLVFDTAVRQVLLCEPAS